MMLQFKYEFYRVKGWRLLLLVPLLALVCYTGILAAGKLTGYGYLSLNEAAAYFGQSFANLREFRVWYARYMLPLIFGTAPVFRWLTIIVAGYFIALSQENGSYSRLILAGGNRKSIFMVSCLCCLVTLCALSLTACLIEMTFAANYWVSVISLKEVARAIAFRVLFDVETVSVAIFLAYAANTLLTAAASGFIVCYLLATLETKLPLFSDRSILFNIVKNLPSIGGTTVWSNLTIWNALVAVTVTAVAVILSYVIFKGRSLR